MLWNRPPRIDVTSVESPLVRFFGLLLSACEAGLRPDAADQEPGSKIRKYW